MEPRLMHRLGDATAAARVLAITLLCAAVLCLPVLAGCSPDSASSDSSASAAQPASSAAASSLDDVEVTPFEGEADMVVLVEIDSSALEGATVFDKVEVGLDEGANAIDALEATGFDVVLKDSEWGSYVDAIGGLATGDGGSASGWIYELNGQSVMDPASECILSDGDTLTWKYVV